MTEQHGSTMRFWGGPLDGREELVRPGWPAPGRFGWPSVLGGHYWYTRQRVTDDGVHIYAYDVLKTEERESDE